MKFDGLIFVYGDAHLLQVLFTCFQVAQFVTYRIRDVQAWLHDPQSWSSQKNNFDI